MPTKLLKQCMDEVLPMIIAIVNKSLTHGHFPSDLKHALINPHLEKPSLDTNELNHYRPVSNLHFLLKIIEKIVVSRLEEHTYAHNLYDPLQSAYRAKHEKQTAIIKLNNDIIGGMDEGKCTILASLNLSAAFDKVDHDILLRRLQVVYGIDETALLWFKLYLKSRTHKVYINDALSERHNLDCGVPQGSVLGARLYSMYAYPLCTTIYCNLSNNANENYLNSELNKISEWLASNKLSLNARKTKFMVFHTVQSKIQYPILTINNTVIERVKQFNFLGIILH